MDPPLQIVQLVTSKIKSLNIKHSPFCRNICDRGPASFSNIPKPNLVKASKLKKGLLA